MAAFKYNFHLHFISLEFYVTIYRICTEAYFTKNDVAFDSSACVNAEYLIQYDSDFVFCFNIGVWSDSVKSFIRIRILHHSNCCVF